MPRLLLSAGDASGDLHAAGFASCFAKRHPDSHLVGLGGDAMRSAGVELVAHQRDLAIGGLVEIAGGLAGVVRAWRAVTSALERERPDLVVLVDSAGFNLPLARRIRRRQRVPVLYYVAPQVWAWRRGRIRKLAARVDRLALIFPFEPEVYAGTGVRADFVGHPLVDEVPEAGPEVRSEARSRCGVASGASPVVALLPGSRRNEVAAHLDVQLETARRIHREAPSAAFLVAPAPSLGEASAAALRARCERERAAGLPLRICSGGAREAMAASDVVLAKPGTVTVECALLGRPLVVVGRAHPLTAWMLRRAIRVPSLTMPNLIAGEAIVPEFLQQEAIPGVLAEAVLGLVRGPKREAQLASLARVRSALGSGGAAEKACRIAEEMLEAAGA